jgi:hypothetical protein
MINQEWCRLRRRARIWWSLSCALLTLAIISAAGVRWWGWFDGFDIPRILLVLWSIALIISMRLGGVAVGYRFGTADALSDETVRKVFDMFTGMSEQVPQSSAGQGECRCGAQDEYDHATQCPQRTIGIEVTNAMRDPFATGKTLLALVTAVERLLTQSSDSSETVCRELREATFQQIDIAWEILRPR